MLRYVTHPQVDIDPHTPIERWGLSDVGLVRAEAMLGQPWIATLGRIISSDETKARQTAEVVAAHLGLEVEVRPDIGENDRSATGFLPPTEFEAMADRFFAAPTESARGWERAVDAQQRISDALDDLLDPGGPDTLVVGHGGVGTLWYCHLTGRQISRTHDQPGQGHYFTVDTATRAVLHGWTPIDHLASSDPADAITAVYDASVPTYVELIGTRIVDGIETAAELEQLERFADDLGGSSPGVVLDAGCGPGRAAAFLAERGVRSVGVDLSASMLSAARSAHAGLELCRGDLARLPFRSDSFVGLVSWYSIIHTPPDSLDALMAEFARVVRRAGRVLLAFQSGDGGLVTREDAYGTGLTMQLVRHDLERVVAALRSAGLETVRTQLRDPVLRYESTPQSAVLAVRR